MIPAIVAVYAMSAPAGYLAGSVYVSQNEKSDMEWFPALCAAFPPLASVIAVVCLTNGGKK